MSDDALDQPPKPTNKERFNRWLRRHKVRTRIEAWHPLIIGCVTWLLVWLADIDRSGYNTLIKDAGPLAVSVAAILAGFQGTIHAILLSMLRSRVVRGLRATGHYDILIHFVGRGVFSLLLFVVVALAALGIALLGKNISDYLPAWINHALIWFSTTLSLPVSEYAFLTGLLIGLLVYAMLASARIMRLIIKMLQVDDD